MAPCNLRSSEVDLRKNSLLRMDEICMIMMWDRRQAVDLQKMAEVIKAPLSVPFLER